MTNHETVLARLDDYVDGLLTEKDLREVEAHLDDCGECRREEAALRALLAEAAELPAGIAPPRDLWEGIEARIRPSAEAETKVRRLVPRSMMHPPRWALQLAAALALVVSTSLITIAVVGRGGGAVPLAPSVATAPDAAATQTAFAAFQPAEAEYERAISDLEQILATRRAQLAPETAATLETNLRIIDEAIRQSREALAKDPNSAELARMLSSVYESKVEVLQQAVQI